MLFVSAENVDRFAKAIATGADLICIDLEDAVHPDLKTIARTNAIAWIEKRKVIPIARRELRFA